MGTIVFLSAALLSATSLNIAQPRDGAVYDGDWLTLRAIVENENQLPDSVHYVLNGQPAMPVPRLDTDWYTYMANDEHTGFSQSPAPDSSLLWTAAVTGPTHEFCSPVIVDGIVYFVSDEQSTAYALDALTGEILWQYDVVNHVDDAVTWYDGKIYVAADSAWCLDALTGDRIWAFKPSPSLKMNGTPALGDGVAYFSFAPDYGSMEIYALDALTGEENWCRILPSYSTGCITLSGSRLFVPTFLGNLYALDISDGSIIWENTSSSTGYWDSSPVLVDDVIYICGEDGRARGIDAQTGSTIWVVDISVGIRYIAATPACAYGNIFFADQVDSYHCLSSLDGSSVWTVPGVQHGSSAVADSIVFFGEGADRARGEVRALSAVTGEEIWSYETGGSDIFSSPAITDGILCIAGMDWNLYAFGTGFMYTYLDDLYAQIGQNELIVTSFYGGSAAASDTVNFTVTGTGLDPETTGRFRAVASPNPFSSSSTIQFQLQEPGWVSLSIYDLSGRCVARLVDGNLGSGPHSVSWSGTGENGSRLAGGVYFCSIKSGGSSEVIGLCLLGPHN